MDGIKIERINPDSAENRGCIHNYNIRKYNNLLVLFRKKGTISGNHYHKGFDKSKNPEIFIILKGKFKVEYFNINNKNKKNIIVISELNKIEIEPFIFHKFTALEDTIFIELQYDKFKGEDVFRLKR